MLMKEHFVTLFDSLFLPQGLALHRSMERHLKGYELWMLCVDNEVYDSLTKLMLPNVRLLKLSELETEDLKRVKVNRTIAEYCWTLTPFSIRFVFESEPEASRVTYVDADVWFRDDSNEIFRELDKSGKDVLITDHAFSPENDSSAVNGQYCVQFLTFTRLGGEVVRKLWEEQCISWCYARHEDGKFGDQKYLDDWPKKYGAIVHVLENKELILAPWNATRFPYGNSIAWHFHGLRIDVSNKRILLDFGKYPLPAPTRRYIYEAYVQDLKIVMQELAVKEVALRPQISITRIFRLKRTLMSVVQFLVGSRWQEIHAGYRRTVFLFKKSE